MIIQSLNGKWTLTIPGAQFHDIPAEVPGSVYHDLLRESLIPDPFYRDLLLQPEFFYRHCSAVLPKGSALL